MQQFDSLKRVWRVLSWVLPDKMAKMGGAFVEGQGIFIFGGLREHRRGHHLQASNDAYRRKLDDKRWTRLDGLSEKRILFETIPIIDGQLYVVGGGNAEGASCETWDI